LHIWSALRHHEKRAHDFLDFCFNTIPVCERRTDGQQVLATANRTKFEVLIITRRGFATPTRDKNELFAIIGVLAHTGPYRSSLSHYY